MKNSGSSTDGAASYLIPQTTVHHDDDDDDDDDDAVKTASVATNVMHDNAAKPLLDAADQSASAAAAADMKFTALQQRDYH